MKMKMKEIEKWVRFWILLIKISLFKIFHENLRKTFLTHFQAISNQSRQKWRWKKLRKWVRYLNSLYQNFHENQKKIFTYFLGHLWLIEAKWKWTWKNLEKWVRFLNTGLLIKIWEKTGFFSKFLPEKDIFRRQRSRKG